MKNGPTDLNARSGPDLSVVIPTYNRADFLKETLAHLLDQSLDPHRFEVIVVDDGSEDETLDMLAASGPQWEERLVVLRQDHKFSGAARNLGVAHARGRVILSMDDDIMADGDMLRHHLRLHEKYPGRSTMVMGRVITGSRKMDLCDPDDRTVTAISKTNQGDDILDPSAFTTQNASFKRRFFQECGGFTPGLKRLDDLDLAFRMKAGYVRLLYCKEAVGTHVRPLETVDAVIDMGKLYGRTLAENYDRLSWVNREFVRLGARFNGGWAHFVESPSGYIKDAVRRLAINRLTIGVLVWATMRLPRINPPSRTVVRCCREIWAFYYRHEFERTRKRLAGKNLRYQAENS